MSVGSMQIGRFLCGASVMGSGFYINLATFKSAAQKAVQRNMLTNPFEKFERKRFLYYSKDLSVISMNHALFEKMKEEDWERVRRQMREDLRKYYDGMGGV